MLLKRTEPEKTESSWAEKLLYIDFQLHGLQPDSQGAPFGPRGY